MNLFSIFTPYVTSFTTIISQFTQTALFIRLLPVVTNSKKLLINSLDQLLTKTSFTDSYYRRNENLWQDGFLIDFLQKKVVDKWTRKFLIVSAYLFNERVVFDRIIRAYLDLVVWSGNKIVIFEFNNVASTLFTIVLLLVLLFLVLSLSYWFITLL